MLPFNKRSRDAQNSTTPSSDLPRFPMASVTGVGQSVPAAPASVRPSARPSARPVLPSFSDDERTMLMPRRAPSASPSSRSLSSIPPAPPSVRPSSRAVAQDEATRTMVRGGMAIPSAPPVPRFDVAPSSPRMIPHSVPPPPVSSSIPAPPMSEGRIDVPAAVITSSTKIIGRPTASWAAALVAMGLFGGLVLAVLARGDGDSLVAAGAQLVDPSHHATAQIAPANEPQVVPAAPAVAAAQPSGVSCAADAVPAVAAPAAVPAQPAVPAAIANALGTSDSAKMEPAKTEPVKVAVAAAAPKPAAAPVAPKPVVKAPPPPPAQPKVAAAPPPPPAPKATPAPKKGGKDDETAKAVKALEDAQLDTL